MNGRRILLIGEGIEMGYVLLYLLVGAATFWPMLHVDRECRDYVLSGGWLSIAIAWVIWCFFWLGSLVVDALFWIMKEPDDDQ